MSASTHAAGEDEGAPDPLVGTLLAGRYHIESLLGAGGMGRIYQAEQRPLGRKVAIKVRNVRSLGNRENLQAQKRFLQEASILSRLQHPNIVTVFDYGRLEGDEESWYMVMEFLAGETLHRRLRAAGMLPAEEVLPVARQIARGLREAHRHGVVHRDLKPSNVMLVADGDDEVVKLVDFGLVKVLADGAEELTREGVFLGSPRYMSPEQIAHGRVDHRTDVYSLGVMLYECLCGKVPFEAESSIQTLIAHMQNPPPWMHERNPDAAVHPALEGLVLRCLEKAPQGRPATMDDFLDELAACEAEMGLASTPSPSGLHPQPSPEQRLARRSSLRAPTIPPAPHAFVRDEPVADVPDPDAEPAPEPLPESHPAPPPERPPALPTAPRSQRPMLYAMMAVTLALSLVALWIASRPTPQPTRVVVQSAPSAPATYELTVESETDGAQVYEGSSLLGAAPLTLTVDNPVVTTRPRQLQVRREGYLPVVVAVGPSALARARVSVHLVPEPPRPAPAATPEPATYTLLVSSPLAFAQVYEGNVRIGQTPLRLEVNNAAVRARPRHLEVRRTGFEPYRFDVGPASAPTLVEARLLELPPRTAVARPAARDAGVAVRDGGLGLLRPPALGAPTRPAGRVTDFFAPALRPPR